MEREVQPASLFPWVLWRQKDRKLPMGVLFCLSDLVPFYERRGWTPFSGGVTLQQGEGRIEWEAEVMTLDSSHDWAGGDPLIHVPNQSRSVA